jgi:hypothetical protein
MYSAYKCRPQKRIEKPTCMPVCFISPKTLNLSSRSFSRFSNSTSFLPLAVTLLGITARFHVLAMDIDNESALLWGEIHKLLQTIEVCNEMIIFLTSDCVLDSNHTKPANASLQ